MCGMKIKKRHVFAAIIGCLFLCKEFRHGVAQDLRILFGEEK